jgi:hypothetical protein
MVTRKPSDLKRSGGFFDNWKLMKLKFVKTLLVCGSIGLSSLMLAQSVQPLNKVEVVFHEAYGPAQKHQLVTDSTVVGGKALRMMITDASAQPWGAGLNSIINAPLSKGDRIEATVMLRLAPDAGQKKGTVKVLFQLKDAPYTEFASSQAQVKAEWTPFRLKAKVPQALAASQSRIVLQLGYGKQMIDVGPILVMKN